MSQINIANLTFTFDGSYDTIFENVSFHIDTNWKLGFTGRNGRGKTTFLNLLLGKYEYKGLITSTVAFEYFPFPIVDKEEITLTIMETICQDYTHWQLVRELSLLEVNDEVLYRPFCTLSNGEQTKVMLAALFQKENSFLLIDEPTNHLDTHGREIVSHYLNSKSGFILISHDRAFLDGCIDHILSINKTNIEIQKGNFSSWLLNKERQDNFELAENEKLKKDIKRLSNAVRQTSNWSDKAEKTKCGTKNSGLRPDTGYIGHKAAKMMQRSKALKARQQTAIEEKSKLLHNIEHADHLKLIQLPFHCNNLAFLKNVTIHYGEKTVCKNISFNIEQGERIALRGKNGCGKSSILKAVIQAAEKKKCIGL